MPAAALPFALLLLLCRLGAVSASFAFLGGGAPAVAAADRLHLLLLHNNDMHARFERTAPNAGACRRGRADCVGGMARTAHVLREHRRLAAAGRGPPVLYLNAGDTYVGTAWFTVYKAEIVAKFLNMLGPDAMSLGNHEFDLGPAGLQPLLEAATFPIIGANLDFSAEPTLTPIAKSTIVTINGQQIGIIGHLTPETRHISQPRNVHFLDVVASVQQEAARLDQLGVKIILVCGHSGFDVDKQIAAEVPLVDVVVGGHTNTFQWNGPPPSTEQPEDVYPTVVVQKSGKRVPVVQAYAYTKYLGRLNLTFDQTTGDLIEFDGQPLLLTSDIPEEPDVLALLETYRPGIEKLTLEVVGQTRTALDAHNCRRTECNFGNFIADAMVAYVARTSAPIAGVWSQFPIGLVNGGGIRTSVDPGEVTRGDLLAVLPFSNQIVTFHLTGGDLRKTLELAARFDGLTSRGEFLQVSGLRVRFDFTKPVGHRLIEVRVRCSNCTIPVYEALQPDELYGVVSISFLMTGGDGHHVLRDGQINPSVQDLDDVNLIVEHFSKFSPVYAEEEGRIEVLEIPSPSAGERVFHNLGFLALSACIFAL